MPPPLLINLEEIDLQQVCLTQEEVYERLPHRHEFALLHGLCHIDLEAKNAVAYRDISADDWWFRGHVPGRPLLPGVLMLEMAAQLSALLAKLIGGHAGFVAFGGVDQCKFREAVVAPCRLYLLAAGTEYRKRRITSETQAVVDGKLIYEARITGMMMRDDPPEGQAQTG